jgi:phage portal protein BeeE
VSWWDRWVWSRVQNREALTLEQLLANEATPTHAGAVVTTDQALRLSAVWACARLLADAVSTLPLDVYRRGDRDPLPELPPLLRTPAAGMSLNEWLYAVMVSLLLRGNAYGIVTGCSGSTLLPAQVDLAHPDRLGVTVLPDGRVQHRLDGKELDPADVWHVRAYAFPGTVLGLSPVEYARQTIGLGRGPHLRRAPEMIAGTTAGPLAYTSPEMRSLDLLTYTVRGWLVRLENAISALLPSTQYCRFNAAAWSAWT